MSDSGDRGDNVVSGSAAGYVVQAKAVHGGVHFHAAPEQSPIPRQLFPPPQGFTNRARELAYLNQFLGRLSVVVLRGQGGVGKTTLALRWLDTVAARFPDGQLYADLALSTGEPVAPEDVLGQFLRALGVPPERVPRGLAERAALYRSVTADK
ncbi:MAG TPA: hypothetical protein VFG87_25010, partial [Amycolatopsis sp.]|nr:hypothetical protein [Amycolatopsis sp.]